MRWITPLLLLGIASPLLAETGSLTFRECFEEALRQSESLAVREEAIRVAEAHTLQALGTVLPHLDVTASESLQDLPGGEAGADDVSSTFVRRSIPEVAVTLQQPLFQGLREFQALKVAKAEKRQNTFLRDRARQLLFLDVAQAYFTVLKLEREGRIFGETRATLLERVRELRERIRIGKSRESELLTTESELASLEAEIETTRGQREAAREMLGFLVGREVSERLVDEFSIPSKIPSVEEFVETLSGRPDLEAQEEGVRLARSRLSYEKGGRLPTVDLEANYYPYRVGFWSDIDWDLSFTLNLPLFQGGATRGRIREAKALLKQSELTRQEEGRRAETDVRQAYHRLKAERSREAALRRAESKAAANYRLHREEYRLGLVSNLEVLETLRTWQERRRASNGASFQAKLEYLQLETAAGRLP